MDSTATIHIAHYQRVVALNETIAIVDRVLAITDRVLNPVSHGNATPLYHEEVMKALRLIDRLESCLTTNHADQSCN